MKMTLSIAAFGFLVVSQIAAAAAEPAAVWPALEDAAAADPAKRHESLLAVAGDAAAPAPVRALALLGAGQTAATPAEAMAAWQRLAEDAAAPAGYRDEARRGIAEVKRTAEGQLAGGGVGHRAELPVLPAPAVVLHVVPSGDDAGGGTETAPLATLAGARNAVRKQCADHGGVLPAGGVRVVIHGGTYHACETFSLGPEDSGTAAAPIVYQAQPGETPILAGGVRIGDWRPLSDEAIKERLAPAVRERVREADLAALGVRDFGDATDLRRAGAVHRRRPPDARTLARRGIRRHGRDPGR